MAKTTAAKSLGKPSTAAKSNAVGGDGATGLQPSAFPAATGSFTIPLVTGPGPKRERVSFGKIPHVLEVPNLIELQKASFEWFKTEGLAEAFASISPIKDF